MYLLISFSCNIQTKGNHLVRLPQRLSLGQRMVILAKMLGILVKLVMHQLSVDKIENPCY